MARFEILLSSSANEPLFGELENSYISLEQDGSEAVLEWGQTNRAKGFTESFAQLVGTLNFEGFPLGVMAGLLANWITMKVLTKSEKDGGQETVSIKVVDLETNRIIELETSSEAAVNASLEAIFVAAESEDETG